MANLSSRSNWKREIIIHVYGIIDDLSIISNILQEHGYYVESVDDFIIDGWIGTPTSSISIRNDGESKKLNIAGYHEIDVEDNVLKSNQFSGFQVSSSKFNNYRSYYHVTGYIMSAYMTSPFSLKNENSLILVWDGGMHPHLYYLLIRA